MHFLLLHFQEARKVIGDTGKQREELEKQIKKMQEELAEYRRKWVSHHLFYLPFFVFHSLGKAQVLVCIPNDKNQQQSAAAKAVDGSLLRSLLGQQAKDDLCF